MRHNKRANTSTTSIPKCLWHHKIHEEWGKERLYFWRLSFNPTFDANKIKKQLEKLLAGQKVLSYAYYELTGMYDLLLRTWLPETTSQNDFESAMDRELGGMDLEIAEFFAVSQVLMHWVWGEPLRIPDAEAISYRLPDSDISALNELAAGNAPIIHGVNDYVNKNLIGPCPHKNGIKFFVVIPSSSSPLNYRGRDDLRLKLLEILRAAKHIQEVSLYSGIGFGQYLIMGRVAPNYFEHINVEIIEKINNLGLNALFRVRTYTHIIAKSNAIVFQDKLPLSEQIAADEQSIINLLGQDETDSLEFKGSGFVDINRYILGEDSTPQAYDYIASSGILKSVVALLNSHGGKVVLGAVERKKYEEGKLANAANEKLTQFPRTKHCIVTGLNWDYPFTKSKDWDGFQLKLQDLLKARVTPSASGWISIKRHEYKGMDVAVVSVRKPNQGWFYLQEEASKPPKFYVREGNRTRELSGPDADLYKTANLRSP